METSHPVATVAVPPLSCRVTGTAPQRKYQLMRCTCCLLYSRCDQRQLDANYRMLMSIDSFSYSRSGWISLARSQFDPSSDVTSPFPSSGNEGYIRNRDFFCYFLFGHSDNHKLISESVLQFVHNTGLYI